MIDVLCKEKQEMQIQMMKNGLTEQFCSEIKEKLKSNSKSIIYVIDDKEHLTGIITLGTVCKNICDASKWINTIFRFIYESDEENLQVKSIFESNVQISSIPVVSEENKIVKEYVRKQAFKSKECYEAFYTFYQRTNKLFSLVDWFCDKGYHRLNLLNYEKSMICDIAEIAYESDRIVLSIFEKISFEEEIHDLIQDKSTEIIVEYDYEEFLKHRLFSSTEGYHYLSISFVFEQYKKYCENTVLRWKNIIDKKIVSYEDALLQFGFQCLIFYNLTEYEGKIVSEIQKECKSVIIYQMDNSLQDSYLEFKDFDKLIQNSNEIFLLCGERERCIPLEIKSDKVVRKLFHWFIQILEYVILTDNRKLIQLIQRLQERHINVFLAQIPDVNKLNLTESEKERVKKRISIGLMMESYSTYQVFLKEFFGKECSADYLAAMYKSNGSIEKNGVRVNVDQDDMYKTVIGGRRVTVAQPQRYDNTIWLMGPCTVLGQYVENDATIPSFLQEYVNENQSGTYRVENLGIPSMNLFDLSNLLENSTFMENDIIIVYTNYHGVQSDEWERAGIIFEDTTSIFQQNSIKNWFMDQPAHMNYKASRYVAKFMYERMVSNIKISCSQNSKNMVCLTNRIKERCLEEYSGQIEAFLQPIVKRQKEGDFLNKEIGCIVMNCNPFTKGHQYLIEYAAACVDLLYIFVVQEDRSNFAFEDRLKLVKLGTAHIPNVVVEKSGEFIISSLTFPGYFTKDKEEKVKVDVSKDLAVFTDYIAPALHIKKRFVGEEPFDIVTKHYNEEMKKYLPLYGVELIEIPRKTFMEKPISASLVRKLLEEKDFAQIEELVPSSTYAYLKAIER